MDIHFVVKEGLRLDRLAGTEVPPAVAHKQSVQALVRGTVACAQGEEPIGLEARLLDRDRLHGFSSPPGDNFRKIPCEAAFDCAAVEFAQHAAPVPACDFLPSPLGFAIVTKVDEHYGQGDKLRTVG